MSKINTAIDDIELVLTAGKPSNDIEVHRRQIRVWLEDAYSTLLAEEIERGSEIPSGTIIKEDCVTLKQDKKVCACENYYTDLYLKTKHDNLEVKGIGTIISIVRQDGSIVTPYGSIGQRNLAKRFAFKNDCIGPRYIKSGDKILLFDGVFPEYEKYTIYYVPNKMTDETNVPDKLWLKIKNHAIKIGKEQLYGSKTDNTNDGRQ